jgi:hypothetical protein
MVAAVVGIIRIGLIDSSYFANFKNKILRSFTTSLIKVCLFSASF